MKSHSLDLLSLCFGIGFIAIAVLWLLHHFDSLTLGTLAWTAAGGLLAMGAIGIGHTLLHRTRPPAGSDHG